MAPVPAQQDHPDFIAWRSRAQHLVAEIAGRDASEVESDFGPFPHELGWAAGDSPAEFVAGAVLPLIDKPLGHDDVAGV